MSGLWNQAEGYDISVLELYPIVLALFVWGSHLKNKSILFLCDNMAVVEVINSQSCRDPYLLTLLRHLVIICLYHNIWFKAKHIKGKLNFVADYISRFQINQARLVQPSLDLYPTLVPEEFRLSQIMSLPLWEHPLLRQHGMSMNAVSTSSGSSLSNSCTDTK